MHAVPCARRATTAAPLRFFLAVLAFGLAAVFPTVASAATWRMSIADPLPANAAIQAAVEDLKAAAAAFGESIETGALTDDADHVILAGTADSHPAIAQLAGEGFDVSPPADPQGFAIRTVDRDGRRTMIVTSRTIQGQVYGLYWLWDRMRVHWDIPEINTTREPALAVRHLGGFTAGDLRQALRYTATWVSDHDALNLIPWGVAPEDAENAKQREQLRPLIAQAHAWGMKYLVYCDEFSYHPDWLARQGATLDPDDPKLWEALQNKYRALFAALPELDGIRIRTGEHTRVGGNYRPLDIMREPENPAWPLERRYRTFVQKMHEVVVGELGKIYFHRTWVANAREQHSDPEVYRAIFTDAVPAENLWLSPYMSLADRWYYQPYNPTFNLTPHKMVVLLSSLDYHAAGNEVFPSFPGQYHQGGMLQVLAAEHSNLDGVHFAMPAQEGWDTATLTGYVAFRLAWEPWVDLTAIARDFASIHLGPEAAPEMARALILSHQAYQDGIYIKPVVEGITGNTLPHLRLTTFPLQGIPQIDQGRAHIEWLRDTMMEPSRGRESEALAFLDLGAAAARVIEEITARSAPRIRNRAVAEGAVRGARQARWLVETNSAYVALCYRYFAYRENPAPAFREALADALARLESTREAFSALENFSYRLYGVDQLLANARTAVADLDAAERALASAPDAPGTQSLIRARQARDRDALAAPNHGYTRALRWRGRVDGKDILHIRGDSVEIEHLAWDPIQSDTYEVFAPLPARPVDVVIRDVESQAPHPFVLEQPSEENNFTASIYLHNSPPGYNWWEIEVYFRE